MKNLIHLDWEERQRHFFLIASRTQFFFNSSILDGSRSMRLSFEAATFHELGHYQHFNDNPREHVDQTLNGNPACEVIANRFAEKALRLYEKTKAGKGLNINMDMNILETVSGLKGYRPNSLET